MPAVIDAGFLLHKNPKSKNSRARGLIARSFAKLLAGMDAGCDRCWVFAPQKPKVQK
jgi:hypothetical protein